MSIHKSWKLCLIKNQIDIYKDYKIVYFEHLTINNNLFKILYCSIYYVGKKMLLTIKYLDAWDTISSSKKITFELLPNCQNIKFASKDYNNILLIKKFYKSRAFAFFDKNTQYDILFYCKNIKLPIYLNPKNEFAINKLDTTTEIAICIRVINKLWYMDSGYCSIFDICKYSSFYKNKNRLYDNELLDDSCELPKPKKWHLEDPKNYFYDDIIEENVIDKIKYRNILNKK